MVETDEARKMAFEAGLDLVEIASEVRPPVCKIMDFGKYKYEQSKKDKANKTRTKSGELKEVRLGRSMKIDPHDVQIRMKQARGFLLEGHRVQFVQNFRGRELAHESRGDIRMQEIITALADIAKVEVPPRLNGKRMGMILVPDRTKVEQFLKREKKAAGAGGGAAATTASGAASAAAAGGRAAAAAAVPAPESSTAPSPAASAPVIETTHAETPHQPA